MAWVPFFFAEYGKAPLLLHCLNRMLLARLRSSRASALTAGFSVEVSNIFKTRGNIGMFG